MIEVIVVGVAALVTSVLSAVAGLGGGVALLLVIAQFLAPSQAIPVQGAIQIVSNGSRSLFLREQITWPIVGWASVLMLPASFVGVAVAAWLPEDVIKLLLAAFVIMVAWRPQLLKMVGERAGQAGAVRSISLGVGALSSFLNATVGASGPVVSPFYRAVTATHVAFVATAGTTQTIAHVTKLVAFSADGWNITDHVPMIGVGIAGVVIGSFIGTRVVHQVSEARLDLLFKVVLTVLAMRIIYSALA